MKKKWKVIQTTPGKLYPKIAAWGPFIGNLERAKIAVNDHNNGSGHPILLWSTNYICETAEWAVIEVEEENEWGKVSL